MTIVYASLSQTLNITGTALSTNLTLAKGARLNLKLTISFVSSCTILPSTDYSISNITASLVFTQN